MIILGGNAGGSFAVWKKGGGTEMFLGKVGEETAWNTGTKVTIEDEVNYLHFQAI